MTNQELQIAVNGICLAIQDSLGDYDLMINYYDTLSVIHPEISNVKLPKENISGITKPRELAKIIWGLIDQIIQDGDEWLDQEKYYWIDRKENEEENNWESKRGN